MAPMRVAAFAAAAADAAAGEVPEGATRIDVAFLRRSRAFQARLMRALHEGGVPILLGADAMTPSVVPGASALEELGDLADADPLADVRNVARLADVMARGRWLPREEPARRRDEARALLRR